MNPVQPEALEEICKQLDAQLDRELGRGAFKQAFLILRGGNPFALKVARVSGANPQRFERETEALKRCSHESIATLYESRLMGHGSDFFWVSVEEYLGHGTLETRLAAGPLPSAEVRRLGGLLARAVEHMAERGFVHRDIKPANILFRDQTMPVLTDFGIVRILGEPSLTGDFAMQGPGTPFFAAPEQLHNDKVLIDWRTDQFDLALVLAFIALGRHAFLPPGGDERDAIEAVAARKTIAPEVIVELQRMGLGALQQALAPWPFQRYATPAQMLHALAEGA